MKKLFAFLTTVVLVLTVNAQTSTRTSSNRANLNAPVGNRTWSVPANTAGTLNNGNRNTHYLYFNNFGFTLPSNVVINNLTVTFSRSSTNSAVDSAVRLVVGGAVYYGSNGVTTNAASSPSTWPGALSSTTLTFNAAALTALTAANINNANFGIVVSARFAGGNTSVAVGSSVSVSISYTTLAPLILTDFSVARNADNHMEIRFSTASEEDVHEIYIERSGDGRTFSKLFTIAPRGARNVYTKYSMVDKTPLQGNNYYRITEVDKNGRWYQYITKLVVVTGRTDAFSAYYNGGQVVTNISSIRGTYEVSLVDMSGITLSKKTMTLNAGTGQAILDAPGRTGVYLAILKGNGMNQSIRVAVTR